MIVESSAVANVILADSMLVILPVSLAVSFQMLSQYVDEILGFLKHQIACIVCIGEFQPLFAYTVNVDLVINTMNTIDIELLHDEDRVFIGKFI